MPENLLICNNWINRSYFLPLKLSDQKEYKCISFRIQYQNFSFNNQITFLSYYSTCGDWLVQEWRDWIKRRTYEYNLVWTPRTQMFESHCNATSPLKGRKRCLSNEQNFSRRIDGAIQVRSNIDSLMGSGQDREGEGELIPWQTTVKSFTLRCPVNW